MHFGDLSMRAPPPEPTGTFVPDDQGSREERRKREREERQRRDQGPIPNTHYCVLDPAFGVDPEYEAAYLNSGLFVTQFWDLIGKSGSPRKEELTNPLREANMGTLWYESLAAAFARLRMWDLRMRVKKVPYLLDEITRTPGHPLWTVLLLMGQAFYQRLFPVSLREKGARVRMGGMRAAFMIFSGGEPLGPRPQAQVWE